jgi:peroxidase
MKKQLLGLITLTLGLGFANIQAQEIRTYDGYGNNYQHPEWGAVGTPQLLLTSNGFADQVSEPGGYDRPNPRHISNSIFNQDGVLPDVLELSDYAFIWGQFIDHDITLVHETEEEVIDVAIPEGDPYFDPLGTGNKIMHVKRSVYTEDSGTDPGNPRAFPNDISAFIDGSAVYGSDEARANWLRTFENGKLKTSAGNLLPYNTTTNEAGSPVDPDAPMMAMMNPYLSRWFVAGDLRANENVNLTVFHTLWVREHNRVCDELIEENPDWNDEQLYQHARRIIGAKIQAIVYEEWLPSLGVHLPEYTGYDALVNPGIMNIFSVAAYRYGHTVVNSTIVRMNNEGNIIPAGNILLRNAFFNPVILVESGGLDPFLIGMATQVEQDFDCKMVHDLRNFLFGSPGLGGLDLAVLNITRGRERGLTDYNTIRTNFGLPALEGFDELSSNPWQNQVFEGVYGDINKIDPWVGMLAEDHMESALFGPTVMAIMARQFKALRDGDRFYYENDPAFTEAEIQELKQTRFKDIIMANTGVAAMQDNVFLMTPHGVTDLYNTAEEPEVEIAAYPNPVTEKLFINFHSDLATEVVLQVTDLKGVVVEEKVVDVNTGMNTVEFDLDKQLPNGVYLVSLIQDGKIGRQRIFKN